MSRISYRRTTPEGWQQTIRRMVLLDGLQIDPETAREAARYLSDHLGLAPEEARPVAYEAERRIADVDYEHDATEGTCTACHSMGRVVSQRRTAEEWRLVVEMHRGYYPLVDFQAFETGPPGEEPQPMDRAVEHLSEAFPLRTPEWAAWSATMRAPRLTGEWLLSGDVLGRGPVYGHVVIHAIPSAESEFETDTSYVVAAESRSVTRTGRAVVYTGFQWRGRSAAGGDAADEMREVMFVERDSRTMTGRWFTGDHDEFGLDTTLRRVGGDPSLAGVYPVAVQTDAIQELRIYGVNLPDSVAAVDIDLGPGIEITRVLDTTPSVVTIEVRVAEDSAIGRRDLFLAQTVLPEALTVYDEVHGVTVTPAAGMARVGGVVAPKQYQQFEARGSHHGRDGTPDTDDDLDLGLLAVEWSLEEYAATVGDDDLAYVGSIDATGLFTPAPDGPNPQRSGNRNNVGDVWVVASYERDGADVVLRGRAHLLVTVPLHMRWFTAESSR